MKLIAKDLCYSYGTRKPVLKGVDLAIEKGERVALQAPSGFGKTTLCRLLAGYLEPDSGEITLHGAPLPKKGVCPVQMILQHPETAVDPRLRIKASLHEAGEVPPQLMERLGIEPAWLTRFPHELSGGELQRICIARALCADPVFLIADEISTMLDAVTQAQIWETLLYEIETRDLGLVFVSHSPALTARIATRIEVLDGDGAETT